VPRDVVALVSAEDFVSAVRVYSDRVNDLLRRSGVPAIEALEVCETYALALLDAVVNAPETVIDLAGWWFARVIELTSEAGRTADIEASTEAISMLAGTSGEAQVRAALARLADSERTAVLLRDGYDLPAQAVGVALRRGADTAAEVTASGRLNLVAAYDGRRPPNLSGHSGRTTVDLFTLSSLADGTLDPPRAAPLRRHVSNCAPCEDVLEALAKGRRLAAGLPIIALDDDAREALIDRVSTRAQAVLPSHDEVLRVVDEDHDPGPAVSPVLAIVALVLAVSLGVAVAAISRADSSPAAPPTPIHTVLPTELSTAPIAPLVSPPAKHHPSRTPSPATTHSTGRSAPASPKGTSTTSAHATGPARIFASPTRGHEGTTITVTGSGFSPSSVVRLTYAGGRSTSTTETDPGGHFTGRLQADSLLPGSETITARSGSKQASTQFVQEV
jgi:DNA-directed RNA polymerase specialized sigma24 family protein